MILVYILSVWWLVELLARLRDYSESNNRKD